MTVKGVNGIEDMYGGEGYHPADNHSNEPWLNSLFENLGEILTGASSIVGAANTSYHRTETKNENINKNSFSWTNGTTITAMVIGGVAIIIVLILIFRKKD